MAEMNDTEFTFEKQDVPDKDALPSYMERLKLSDEQKERLQKEVYKEWKVMKEERESKQLEQKWEALEEQYKGKLRENKARMFNIDLGTTASKIDKIVSNIMKAFTKQDPKFAITPRPELARHDGYEVCQKQSDFIDDRLDSLPFYPKESRVVHSAVLKGTGILKIIHKIEREERKREETYEGKIEPILDPNTGKPSGKFKNTALKDFLNNWPDAPTKYPGFVKSVAQGKSVSFIANYTETTYNDPWFECIELKNFYTRISTEGLLGLKKAKLTVERRNVSWWDLEREKKLGNFYDIEKVISESEQDETSDYKHRMYDILECTYYGKLNEDDADDVKMILWFGEETKKNIGAILFPYFLIDCQYIPHYIMNKEAGFYQPGVGERLTDKVLAEDALINFGLEGAWITNMVTPITDDDEIIAQFEEHKFTHGIPIHADLKKIDFLQKYMKEMDYMGILGFLKVITTADDDTSRVSPLMVGRKQPQQSPQSPLGETQMLAQSSGEGIEDYIVNISPSWNEIGYIILNMYFQMSKEGLKYKPHSERTVGKDPFETIERADLIARTNIQVMAYAFNFNKQHEKQEDVGFLQFAMSQPLIAKNPEAMWAVLSMVIKGWSPKWRNLIDTVLPTLSQLKQKSAQVSLQAVVQYLNTKKAESMVTGQPPEFKAEELMPLVQQLQAQLVQKQEKIEVKHPAMTWKKDKVKRGR